MSSIASTSLLHLLQLVSPALPVGAYSYSEGIETLVQANRITTAAALEHWLVQELRYGAIRLETAVLVRIYEAAIANQLHKLNYWNQWLSAFRETEELREQSWQMGRSLVRLLQALHQEQTQEQKVNGLNRWIEACGEPCNFVVAFGLAAAAWQIDIQSTTLGYLHSWAGNLVNAGVRLIPLGQTQGQQTLLNLSPQLEQTVNQILHLKNEELWNCSWGMTIASMNHETLYSRLFRS